MRLILGKRLEWSLSKWREWGIGSKTSSANSLIDSRTLPYLLCIVMNIGMAEKLTRIPVNENIALNGLFCNRDQTSLRCSAEPLT